MYRITDINTTTNQTTGAKTYTTTKYDYTTQVSSYDTSTSGMYASTDNDGTTYYYRGTPSGNYVSFAGKFWRIVMGH